MPFTRISLLRGKSPEYLKAISDTFHEVLVEAFDAPAADKFQSFHQLEPHELIFDRNYLAGPRSDDYVFFDITVGKPRSAEVKQAFYRRLAERLGQTPGIRPEDVMVTITTAQREDWSFGDGRAQMLELA